MSTRSRETSRPRGAIPDDHAVFASMYPALRRFARAVCPPESDADDLVQEALVRTLARGPLTRLDDPAAYLRTAVYRLAANDRRRLGRRRTALARLRADGDERALQPVPSDVDELRHLPARDRAVLYLSIVEGRTHAEVARLVGDSETAVRTRCSRALRRLRVTLTEEDRDADRG